MGNLFYELGRLAGPAWRKGAWVWRTLAGTDREILAAEEAVGRDLARAFAQEMPPEDDAAVQDRVAALGAKLAARVRNKLRRFNFAVVRAEAPNAFALPGGFVFVTRPLIDLVGAHDEELAFVLAHEMGHVVNQDPIQRLLADSTIAAAMRALPGSGLAGSWVRSVGARVLQSSYSQDRELSADEAGVRLARAAGFDPFGSVRLLARLRDAAEARDPGGSLAPFFATHPPFELRTREIDRFLRLTGPADRGSCGS